ncbi:MAG: 2-hydroxyacid dehydrogenase [Patescibacteria group bacterium]|jgi:D-lactate dehydrogenase
MRVVHLNVTSLFSSLLQGEKYPLSLEKTNTIANPHTIEAVTLTPRSKVNDDNLQNLPSLKLIVTRSVGVDHIDKNACKKRNIAVYHIEDYGAFNIAEHTLALLLSGTRNIVRSQRNINAGKFEHENLAGFALRNKTVGIIGTGKIGLEFIKLLKPFDVNVIAYDIFENYEAQKRLGFTYTTFESLLKESDVISLHAPLTPKTRHMVNQKAIQLMKEDVILVNTARGDLINTQDLVKNIVKFRFVGLDVLEDEASFSKSHPLLAFHNVLITPHMAYLSEYSLKKICEETEKCITSFMNNNSSGRIV